MAVFLILRLTGPLMSFGDVAVDETRPTAELPGLSQLTGLLANALGWRSGEGERLNRLQERIVFGARRDKRGELLVDYQNAHVSSGQSLWRARADAPLVRTGGGFDNVQRWRHYIADGEVRVALTLLPEAEEPGLDAVSRALMRPFRPLFLGRVSCPPSVPIHLGERVEADSVRQALERIPVAPRVGSFDGLAEWPAQGPLCGEGHAEATARLVCTRMDLREWRSDIPRGGRLVARGVIRPSAGRPSAGRPSAGRPNDEERLA